VGGLVIYFLNQFVLGDYIIDDTFIHLTYARNLATGHGFSFNPDYPTYGVSAPLWTLLLALTGLITGFSAGLAKVYSILCGAVTIPMFFLLAQRLRLSPMAVGASTLVWAANVWLNRWAASGMEATLAVLILMLTFHQHLKDRPISTGIWAGVAILSRPETAGLLLLLAIDRVRISDWKEGARTLISGMLIVIPWLIYAFVSFGTIIPNPALIKSDRFLPPFDDFLLGLKRVAGVVGGAHGLELIVILVVLIFLVRRRSHPEGSDFWIWGLIGIWAAFPAAVYLSRGIFVQSRYLLIGLPPLIIAGFASLQWLIRKLPLRLARSLILTAGVALIVQQAALVVFVTLPHVRSFKPTLEALSYMAGRVKNDTPPGSVVAVGDVGIMGYYSERTVLDLEGLISPEIIPRRRLFQLDEFILTGEFLKISSPDFIIDKSKDERRLEGLWGAEFLESKAVPGGLIDTADQSWYYSLYRLPPI
jgi:hypothetical protein